MRALPCEYRAGRVVDGPLMSHSIVLLLLPRVIVRYTASQRMLSAQSQHCVMVEVNTCVRAPVKGALLELGGDGAFITTQGVPNVRCDDTCTLRARNGLLNVR